MSHAENRQRITHTQLMLPSLRHALTQHGIPAHPAGACTTQPGSTVPTLQCKVLFKPNAGQVPLEATNTSSVVHQQEADSRTETPYHTRT